MCRRKAFSAITPLLLSSYQRAIIICIVRQSVCLAIVRANHRVSVEQVSMEKKRGWAARLPKLGFLA